MEKPRGELRKFIHRHVFNFFNVIRKDGFDDLEKMKQSGKSDYNKLFSKKKLISRIFLDAQVLY